jgi:hypothetical protein
VIFSDFLKLFAILFPVGNESRNVVITGDRTATIRRESGNSWCHLARRENFQTLSQGPPTHDRIDDQQYD